MVITGAGAPGIAITELRPSEGASGLGPGGGAAPKGTFADKLATAVDGVSNQ